VRILSSAAALEGQYLQATVQGDVYLLCTLRYTQYYLPRWSRRRSEKVRMNTCYEKTIPSRILVTNFHISKELSDSLLRLPG